MINSRFEKYEDVYSSFTKFFNRDHLDQTLNQKVDAEIFENIVTKKVGTNEHYLLEVKVDNLNEKLKHLSIVQMEMAEMLVPIKKKSIKCMEEGDKNNIGIQLENLSRNSKIISTWINSVQLGQNVMRSPVLSNPNTRPLTEVNSPLNNSIPISKLDKRIVAKNKHLQNSGQGRPMSMILRTEESQKNIQ